ncbi:MAG: MBL fold metallo-hydrolase [Candidatus Competibacteraceae bacterium]|nr:MBL fold metallo-hydrolase [Candidatus Competibacteraceae bacterium]
MKPLFQSELPNGPFADPVLYLDFLFEKRALLFDAGDLRALPTRKLLRVSHLGISHCHMDHFGDFDWLLRLLLGRDKRLELFGPAGFIERLGHRLASYSWNLVHNYSDDLVFTATELHPCQQGRRTTLRLSNAFRPEDHHQGALPGNILAETPAFLIRGAVLDHGGIPCLGYCVEEKAHINLWKNRLMEMGLPVGPWLQELKQSVLEGKADDTPITARWRQDGGYRQRVLPLGELNRRVVKITPGQKVGYIVDVGPQPDNLARMVDLLRGCRTLFIEAGFLEEDAGMASKKGHLTARQAGLVARRAGVAQLVPFHFSPRYSQREGQLRAEAQAALMEG